MHQQKKRQHTVPQMFLSAFSCEKNDAQLYQYSRDSGDVFRVAIEDATVQKHAYSIHGNPKLNAMFLEDSFMRLEAESCRPLRRLRSGERIDELSEKERYRLSEFFAVQIKRTTAMLQHRDFHASEFSRPENTISYVEKNRSELEQRYGREGVDNFIDQINRTGIGLEVPRSQTLLQAFVNIPRWTDLIFKMNWRIQQAPKNEFFVTSDNPVFVRRRGRPRDTHLVGLERSDLDAEMYVAISPSRFLLASWDQPRARNTASTSRVLELNRLTVLMATRFIYSSRIMPSIEQLINTERDFRLTLPDLIGQVLAD